MTLWDTINQQLRQAMKNHRQETVDALRLLSAALTNQRIAKGGDLTDDEVARVLQGEAKKRRESIVIYRQAKREDLADKEEFELKIIESFLPMQLSVEAIKKIIKDLKTAGKLGPDFGSAMKQVMAEVKGRADGAVVAQAVKQAL